MASRNPLFHCLPLLILAVASFAATDRLSRSGYYSTIDVATRHEQWMAQNGRVYRDAAEKEYRRSVFKRNVEYVESVNRRNLTYKLAANKFADMTNEEFKAARNRIQLGRKNVAANITPEAYESGSSVDLPSSVDWRTKGAVNGIKNQGTCGCCWAFAAAAAIESANQIKTGTMVSLSEQQLVDCDIKGDDQGCEGGLPDNALKYVLESGGLASEGSYPYKEGDGTCQPYKPAVSISNFKDVQSNSESSLLQAVAAQPVAVRINGGARGFQLYSSGVFTGPCPADLDHDVLIIGYGADSDGTKYWLVKNSWGTSWGEDGFMRIERDADAPAGMCGLATHPSYPII